MMTAMKILVLIGFVTLASGNNLEEESKHLDCVVKGPKFWCQDKVSAKSCHAVKYCKKYVWSKDKQTSPDSTVCDYCQEFVGTLNEMLAVNGTEAEIISGMKLFCTLLPESTKSICTSVVEQYGEKIVKYILQYTKDSKRLCIMINLCTAESPRRMLANEDFLMTKKVILKQLYHGDYCESCKGYIAGLHSMMSSKQTKADLVIAMKKMCSFLPSGKFWCHTMVDFYGEKLVDSVINYLNEPSKVCSAVHLCPEGTRRLLVQIPEGDYREEKKEKYIKFTPEEPIPNDMCMQCQQYVGTVYMLLMNNETQAEVIASAEALCNYIPNETGKFICDEVIKTYGNTILQEIVQYLKDPKKFCTLIHLCTSDSERVLPNNFLLLSKVVKDKVFGDYCIPCKNYINDLRTLTSLKKTELMSGMRRMCEFLPKSISSWCVGMVDVKGEQMLESFLEYTQDPSKFCTKVFLCRSQDVPIVATKTAVVPVKSSSKVCKYCQEFVGTVRMLITSGKTEDEIIAGMESLCLKMPEELSKTVCVGIVKEYGKEIITDFLKYTQDPRKLCGILYLCSKNTEILHDAKYFQVTGKLAIKAVFESLVPKYGISCAMCEYAAQVVYQSLADKPTQERIKFALMLLCTKLPSKDIQTECTSVVTNHYDELMDIVLNELKNSKQLCQLVKCSSKKVLPVPNGEICDTCIKGVEYAAQLLESNKTKEIFMFVLYKVCELTPITDECKKITSEYAAKVFEFLKSQLKDGKKTCEKLHLCCSSRGCTSKLTMYPIKNGELCQACVFAANFLKGYLAEEKTKEALKNYLLQDCSLLPASVAGMCKEYVNSYFPMVYELLTKELTDTTVFCQQLQLCSSKIRSHTKVSPPIKDSTECEMCTYMAQVGEGIFAEESTKQQIKSTLLQLCAYVPTSVSTECTTFITQSFEAVYDFLLAQLKNPQGLCQELKMCTPKGNKLPTSMKSGTICEACKMATQYVETFLNSTSTRSELKNAILDVCAEIPGEMGKECTAMVNNDFDEIYSFLLQQVQSLCQDIGLCPSSAKGVSVVPKKSNGVECYVCELVLEKLDVMLNGSRVEEKVKDALNKLCDDLPFQGQCHHLVDTYSDKIIELLVVQLEHPEHVCTQLSLCSSFAKKDVSIPKKSNGKVECFACELLLSNLESMLKGSRIEDDVRKALGKLCADLPFSSQCKALVDEYSEQIIELIVVRLKEPEHVCTLMKLCKPFIKVHRKALIKPSNGGTCEFCKLAIGELKKQLSENATETEIKGLLKKLCSYMKSFEKQCDGFVEEYTDEIAEMIIKDLDPETICKALDLCKSKKARKATLKLSKNVNGNPITCVLCEYSINELLKRVEGKKTKDEIKEEVEKLCEYLPSYVEKCHKFVEKYTDEIVEMVIKGGGDSHYICKKIGYCLSSMKALPPVEVNKHVGGDPAGCGLCMFMTGKLDVHLKTHTSKKMIMRTIKTICKQARLSDEKKEGCERMLDEFKDTLYKLIKKDKLPLFCQKIGQCRRRPAISDKSGFVPALRTNKVEGVSCVACKYLVGVLDSYLSGKAAKDTIISKVHGLCNELPRPIFVTECNALIGEYGGEMVQLFVDNVLTPVGICESFNLC